MIDQIRAELLKIRSTRTTLGLFIGMLALVLLFVLLGGLVSPVSSFVGKEAQRSFLGLGHVAELFAALAGVLVVTSETRHGTVRPTFAFTPQRPRVVGAKAVAAFLAGLVFGVFAEGIGFAIGELIFSQRGVPLALTGGDVAVLLGGTFAGSALWGALGVGLGLIVPQQVGAIIGLLAWVFVVENLVFGFEPSWGRFAPGEASTSMTGSTAQHLLSPAVGTAVLVAWVVVLYVVGLYQVVHRDVS